MSSLSLRIGTVVALTLTLLVLAMGWASYAFVTRHFDQLLDSELHVQAEAVREASYRIERASTSPPSGQQLSLEVENEPMAVTGFQYWGSDNRLLTTSRNLQSVALDGLPPGFANFSIEGKRWRALTELKDGRWIRVAQRADVRRAVARSSALEAISLLGVGVPLLVALVMLILRRALTSVHFFAEQIGRCEPGRSGPIGPATLPDELEPIVASINGLLSRCRVAGKAHP